MRRRSTLLFLAATITAATATRTLSAQAPTVPPPQAPQKVDHPIQFIVNGGLTVPASDLKEFNDPGFHVAGSLLFKFAGFPLRLRPELSLTRLKQKIPALGTPSSSYAADADSLLTTQMIGALGNFELPLVAGLYVIAGVGALKLDTQSANQTTATFNGGAGWRFQLGRLGGFIEGRYGSASYEAGKFGFTGAQFIPVSFGVIF